MPKRPESLSYSLERRRESRGFFWLGVAGGIWHVMKIGIIVMMSAMVVQGEFRLALTNMQWLYLVVTWVLGAYATSRD